MHHDLKVVWWVACTTDCEPSMVKAGHILQERKFCMHIDCCNHRLERTTGIVFDGPGVKKAKAFARALVTRYSTSSRSTCLVVQHDTSL